MNKKELNSLIKNMKEYCNKYIVESESKYINNAFVELMVNYDTLIASDNEKDVKKGNDLLVNSDIYKSSHFVYILPVFYQFISDINALYGTDIAL